MAPTTPSQKAYPSTPSPFKPNADPDHLARALQMADRLYNLPPMATPTDKEHTYDVLDEQQVYDFWNNRASPPNFDRSNKNRIHQMPVEILQAICRFNILKRLQQLEAQGLRPSVGRLHDRKLKPSNFFGVDNTQNVVLFDRLLICGLSLKLRVIATEILFEHAKWQGELDIRISDPDDLLLTDRLRRIPHPIRDLQLRVTGTMLQFQACIAWMRLFLEDRPLFRGVKLVKGSGHHLLKRRILDEMDTFDDPWKIIQEDNVRSILGKDGLRISFIFLSDVGAFPENLEDALVGTRYLAERLGSLGVDDGEKVEQYLRDWVDCTGRADRWGIASLQIEMGTVFEMIT